MGHRSRDNDICRSYSLSVRVYQGMSEDLNFNIEHKEAQNLIENINQLRSCNMKQVERNNDEKGCFA